MIAHFARIKHFPTPKILLLEDNRKQTYFHLLNPKIFLLLFALSGAPGTFWARTENKSLIYIWFIYKALHRASVIIILIKNKFEYFRRGSSHFLWRTAKENQVRYLKVTDNNFQKFSHFNKINFLLNAYQYFYLSEEYAWAKILSKNY